MSGRIWKGIEMTLSIKRVGLTVITFAIALILCFPIFWTMFTGFKSESDAISIPPSIFVPLSFDHYVEAVSGDYPHFLLNTVLAVLGSIIAAFALALPAAYKLAFFP